MFTQNLAYYIIYFYVYVEEPFTVSWKIFHGVEILCATA